MVDISPSPLNYELGSTLDKSKAKSFGTTREAYKKVMLRTMPIMSSAPGPGAYTLKSKIGTEGTKFTMRKRTNLQDNITSKIVPGPGNYALFSTINADGKFKVAGFRDSGAAKFPPQSSVRFTEMSIK